METRRCISNIYSILPCKISIDMAPKAGMFPEAEGRGKYSLPRVQYVSIFHKEGLNIYLLHRISLFHNCTNLLNTKASFLTNRQ